MITAEHILCDAKRSMDRLPEAMRGLEERGYYDASILLAAVLADYRSTDPDLPALKFVFRILRGEISDTLKAYLAEREAKRERPAPEPFEPPSVEAVPENRGTPIVYFIQAMSGGPIKIGYTKNISQRLAAAQTHSAERLIVIASFPGGAAEEGALHWKLKAHRVNGEWYAPVEAVMDEIERIASSA